MDDMVGRCLRHRCFLGLLLVFERFRDLRFNFFAEFRVVLQNAFHGIASLSDLGLAIAEPRTALFDDAELRSEVNDFPDVGDAFAEGDFKFGFAEWRCHFVFHHLHAHLVADGLVAVFDGGDAADVEAHALCRRWLFQGCRTSRRSFRATG